jgi:hypothetical protein
MIYIARILISDFCMSFLACGESVVVDVHSKFVGTPNLVAIIKLLDKVKSHKISMPCNTALSSKVH